MKFISWNVNGLRACVQKGFLDYFHSVDADFFCIQESKLQEGQIALDLPVNNVFVNTCEGVDEYEARTIKRESDTLHTL